MGGMNLLPLAPDPYDVRAIRDLVCRRGILVSPPMWAAVDGSRVSDLGVYVTGWQDASLVLTMGHTDPNDNSTVVAQATRSTQSATYQIPAPMTGRGKCHFAPLADNIVFSNGGAVFTFNMQTFEFATLNFTYSGMSATSSYILATPRANDICVHQGKVFFGGLAGQEIPLSRAITPGEIDDPTMLDIYGGSITYRKNQYMWSDPFTPDNTQALSFGTVDDASATILRVVSMGSGTGAVLVIVTDRGLWTLEGFDSSTRIQTFIDGRGCIAGESVVKYGPSLYYLGATNIYKYTPGAGVEEVTTAYSYFRQKAQVLSMPRWTPSRGAVGVIGANFPYYMVTDPDHKSALVVDLTTGVVADVLHGWDVHCGCSVAGTDLLPPDNDVLFGATSIFGGASELINLDWSYDQDANADWTCIGPLVVPEQVKGTVEDFRVLANETSGVLSVVLMSGENAHNLRLDGTNPVESARQGPWVWDTDIVLTRGDTTDSLVLLAPAATTGAKLLASSPPAGTVYPRLLPTVITHWCQKPTVSGMTFYLLVKHVPVREPLEIHQITLDIKAAR